MIRFAKSLMARFRRDEDGSAMLIEFVIFVPLLFGIFMMGVELGIYSMRQMFLDRGLDITVRHVRLNTNADIKHDTLKAMICENAGFIEDCNSTLRLEMTPINPRAFVRFNTAADCVDTSEEAKPLRNFKRGGPHEIMVLRACVMFTPVFPTTGLGYAFQKDGTNRARMVSAAVFVQEPS